jgi:hypothetical protein
MGPEKRLNEFRRLGPLKKPRLVPFLSPGIRASNSIHKILVINQLSNNAGTHLLGANAAAEATRAAITSVCFIMVESRVYLAGSNNAYDAEPIVNRRVLHGRPLGGPRPPWPRTVSLVFVRSSLVE